MQYKHEVPGSNPQHPRKAGVKMCAHVIQGRPLGFGGQPGLPNQGKQELQAVHFPQLPAATVHDDHNRGAFAPPCMATVDKGQSQINPEPLGPGSWKGLARSVAKRTNRGGQRAAIL